MSSDIQKPILTDFEQQYGDATLEYDDTYKISILRLLYDHPVKDVHELSELLDTNGFLSRYRIEQVADKHDKLIKLHIEIIKSNFIYTWPYGTTYSFYKKKIMPYKPKFNPNPQLEEGMNRIVWLYNLYKDDKTVDMNTIIGYFQVRFRNNISLANRGKILDQLFELKLFKKDKFRLLTEQDVHEYCDNLFNNKMY